MGAWIPLVTVVIWANLFTTSSINICLSSGTEGVHKIQSETQNYDNKAVLTQADLPPSTPTPPPPMAIPWCMEIKVHIWLKLLIFHWLTADEKEQTPAYFFFFFIFFLSQNDTVELLSLSEILKVHYNSPQRGRCSMQRHRREPISMTQPALSSISTKLRAHLLPVGHRQKPTALQIPPPTPPLPPPLILLGESNPVYTDTGQNK